MRASSFSSLLLPCSHGHGGGRATASTCAAAAAACLALVALVILVVSMDPRAQASSWFFLSSSSLSSSSSTLVRPAASSHAASLRKPSSWGGGNGGGRGGEHLLVTSSSFGSGGGARGSWSRNSTSKEVLFQGGGGGGGDEMTSTAAAPTPALIIGSSSGDGVSPSRVAVTAAAAEPTPALAPAPAPEWGVGDAASGDDIIQVMPQAQRRRDVKLERLELGLAKARATIREAIQNKDNKPPLTDKDYVPVGPVYRNAYAFHRSYLEMEKVFKVFVYEEGEPPVFHDGPCRSIYSTEGRFIYAMEMENRMRTRDPDQAHVFFLPFSVVKMVKMIYEPNSHDMDPLRRTISDYINVVSTKYPHWNRSLGADHFMLSCHDWGPYVSSANGHLFSNSIRVLCNANTSEGFDPSRDVSLPEINLRSDAVDCQVGGPSASHRPILAFFAGGDHGPVRPLLLQHWGKGQDADIQVSEYLPRRHGMSYTDMMRRSRFCLCPSGYEVASPRVVEAIYLECVPVVIGNDYALPFADVLNWAAFSVRLAVGDIPRLKEILAAVSPRQYIRMQRRVRAVRRHFMVSDGAPRRFDVFHMILHSIWLRRLNVRVIARED
ncbi:probable glycosyltransferase At5g03795 [Oryza glaberrima]|uniref:Exostosin GT47 domain-containing protein n=1 Tax=Oryza glaberrima TaxID=4538 RepID=I1Q8N7_ORYGL|nr:probable glycosyltransferase At5g03795 [Oryza glaberrima]